MKKVIKFVIFPLILYFSIFMLYGHEYVTDPATTYQNPGYDQDGSSFIKYNFAEKYNNNDFSRYTNTVQYPFGWILTDVPYGSIIDYVVIYPASWFPGTSIYFWHNIGVIFIYLSAPLFAFYLAYYLTKNYTGSIIAGYIFAFTGLNLWYAGGNDPLAHFQFIPLFFLALFYYLRNQNGRSFLLVVLASTLNTITNIYWGWFIYLSVGVIASADYFFLKNFFSSFKKYITFLVTFGLLSVLLSVLLNLNFFFYSAKFLQPEVSRAANRAADSLAYSANPIQRYFLPSSYSLWQNNRNNMGDYFSEYIPLIFLMVTILLFFKLSKIDKEKKWIVFICSILIVFYIFLASTNLQQLFRIVMPPIVAYSRTSIFITLFFGLLIAIYFSTLDTKKKYLKYSLYTLLIGLLLLDTINKKAFYTTDFRKDLPPIIGELASKKDKDKSLLIYPLNCGSNGYQNLLFQTFHEIPIANPYFATESNEYFDLCKEVNNPYNPRLLSYIKLLNVGYVVVYPKVEPKVTISSIEKILKPCIQSKKNFISTLSRTHSFIPYFTAILYEIKENCLSSSFVKSTEITNTPTLTVVPKGDETKALREYPTGNENTRLIFEKYSKVSQLFSYAKIKRTPVNFTAKKLNKYEYNIQVESSSTSPQLFFLNSPLISSKGWKLFKIEDINDTYSFFHRYKEVPATFFGSNLYETSVYIPKVEKGEMYKIVFIANDTDIFRRRVSEIAIIIALLSGIILFIFEYRRVRKYNNEI